MNLKKVQLPAQDLVQSQLHLFSTYSLIIGSHVHLLYDPVFISHDTGPLPGPGYFTISKPKQHSCNSH